jgi:hypothetical protein
MKRRTEAPVRLATTTAASDGRCRGQNVIGDDANADDSEHSNGENETTHGGLL